MRLITLLSHYSSNSVGSSCLPESVPRKWDTDRLCSLVEKMSFCCSFDSSFLPSREFSSGPQSEKVFCPFFFFFKAVLNLCFVPDVVNPWAVFDPQECFLLGKYFKNWEN